MNIQEAKEEIEKAVRAYTAKTEEGMYRIPAHRQRPLLLIGPPGIGKTAIMEQIARECGIGLVAYTMTHHTRQSAVGLPMLEKRSFDGREYTVTAYTMSEILASVYEQRERSGCMEGILFLDEINCVSETLMPSMLQFLQYKTFGGHALPEGWVIAAAGNPPAYNRSVREFDTVTLDRVRLLEIAPDLAVWKAYAMQRGLHPAVLSFLELRPERFCVMEPGQEGFVTGRAWEDLSEILLTMEELSLGVEEALFGQYLQEEDTALEFALYYRIYEKWKVRLRPDGIPSGEAGEDLPELPFDERLCIVWLLLGRLHAMGEELSGKQKLADSLRYFTDSLGVKPEEGAYTEALETLVRERLESRKKGLAVRKENGLLTPEEERAERTLARILRACQEEARLSGNAGVFGDRSRKESGEAKSRKQALLKAMENAEAFVRQSLGGEQELVVLLTGIREDSVCARLAREGLPKLWERMEEILDAGGREAELRQRLSGK